MYIICEYMNILMYIICEYILLMYILIKYIFISFMCFDGNGVNYGCVKVRLGRVVWMNVKYMGEKEFIKVIFYL